MPAINPALLVWARETSGLTTEEAARRLGLKAARGKSPTERLAALETGAQVPTRPLLLKIAKQYHRPLLTFYLPSPPHKGDRGTDFRTLPAALSVTENALLDALIREVSARQSMVRAVLEEEDEATPVSFVGSMQRADGVPALVSSMRHALHIDLTRLRAEISPEASFSLLREHAEALGVFVLLIGNLGSHRTAIGVETFRGFALADPVAPFVVVNDQDAKSAWSFSLLHEMAHLWLGQTGISSARADSGVEQFCNDVAGEFLLPSVELTSLQLGDPSQRDKLTERVNTFALDRNVSSSMVAYKLYRTGRIGRDTWQYLSDTFRQHWLDSRSAAREQARGREGGPSYYVVRRHRVGAALMRVVGRLLASGALTTTKAGKILGVKPQGVQILLGETTPQQRAA